MPQIIPHFYAYGHAEGATCAFSRIETNTIEEAQKIAKELAINNGIVNLMVCSEAEKLRIEEQPSIFDLMADTNTNSEGESCPT